LTLCKRLWEDSSKVFRSESDLAALAVRLGAEAVQPWSAAERALAAAASSSTTMSARQVHGVRDEIQAGGDPLGDALCALRSPVVRREAGATYTPAPIIRAMGDWASAAAAAAVLPERVIDPGTGSARFLIDAGKRFPHAALVGIETDPLAALIARANLAVVGFAGRARVVVGDYRRFAERTPGRTLYIGNPPYVRHHGISPRWKRWLGETATRLGLRASKLAGLHVHFFLATARHATPGDYGVFITAAEWLDVNYGALVRSLLLGPLGGRSITIIEPTAQPFPDAATTAAITTFAIAARTPSGAGRRSIGFRRVDSLDALDRLESGRRVSRERLSQAARWSQLTRSVSRTAMPSGYVELGELCQVHRGQVTGANGIWIAGAHSGGLPESVLFRAVTRAREVFDSQGVLEDAGHLRCVIDLPVDLDRLDVGTRCHVDRFLAVAKSMGGSRGYIARHRKAWWSVGLRAPAPIIATYMARRPPAFTLNHASARHINIAHGLYPREAMTSTTTTRLVAWLRANISQRSGRTYAGGLTKFEPREMERLLVPSPELLAISASTS
jgi:adenine-specific DNA-methyltransferase